MKKSIVESKWAKTLLLACFVLIVYIFLAMVFTGFYTRHGQAIIVPNVSGMPISNAGKLLEEKKLVMIVIDSVYKEDIIPGTIVEQDPQADLKVKPGRKIYVTMNTGIIPKVKMPKLINGSSNLAIVLLVNAGLKLGRIDSVKSAFGPGLVINQKYRGNEIPPNTPLEKGSIIDIVVSKKMTFSISDSIPLLNQSEMELID